MGEQLVATVRVRLEVEVDVGPYDESASVAEVHASAAREGRERLENAVATWRSMRVVGKATTTAVLAHRRLP